MTSNGHDPALQHWFVEASQDLEGERITAQVMARTQKVKLQVLAGVVLTGLIVLLLSWLVFAGPLRDFALLLSGLLATPLIDLGEGWLALVFMPLNTGASIAAVVGKVAWNMRKKLLSLSFSN